jgi:hypothetical protein
VEAFDSSVAQRRDGRTVARLEFYRHLAHRYYLLVVQEPEFEVDALFLLEAEQNAVRFFYLAVNAVG